MHLTTTGHFNALVETPPVCYCMCPPFTISPFRVSVTLTCARLLRAGRQSCLKLLQALRVTTLDRLVLLLLLVAEGELVCHVHRHTSHTKGGGRVRESIVNIFTTS